MRAALLALLIVGCHKHREDAPQFQVASSPATATTPVVAATAPTAPTETASSVASAVPSATASAKSDPETAKLQALREAQEFGTIGGLGNVGTVGHGTRLPIHQIKSPRLHPGAMSVNGRLPPEVVRRIVRQNFGRYRLCYENGLRSNPTLAGTVAVKFVIDASGAVSSSQRDGATTLPDTGVVDCVVRGFGNMSFPQPEGGIVTVVFPIIMDPGDE